LFGDNSAQAASRRPCWSLLWPQTALGSSAPHVCEKLLRRTCRTKTFRINLLGCGFDYTLRCLPITVHLRWPINILYLYWN